MAESYQKRFHQCYKIYRKKILRVRIGCKTSYRKNLDINENDIKSNLCNKLTGFLLNDRTMITGECVTVGTRNNNQSLIVLQQES